MGPSKEGPPLMTFQLDYMESNDPSYTCFHNHEPCKNASHEPTSCTPRFKFSVLCEFTTIE